MGKVNNALRMLAILRSRKKVTRKELAEELEVNEREITRYKEDLESAGVTINNTRGKYGGYELIGNDYLLNLDLSYDELNILDRVKDDLKTQGSHYYTTIDSINNKVRVASNKKFEDIINKDNYYSKGVTLKIDLEEEKSKWLTINDGIINKKKIQIEYIDSKGKETKRIVNPYGLFTYYGANFFVGLCNTRNEIRTFKLVRINKVKLIKDETFERGDFNLKTYLDNNIGLFNDGRYNIKLKIKYPYAQGFKEFKWLDNEIITDHQNEGYIIYEALSNGKTQTIEWIMGMGNNCTVLEPEEIRNEVIACARKIIEDNRK